LKRAHYAQSRRSTALGPARPGRLVRPVAPSPFCAVAGKPLPHQDSLFPSHGNATVVTTLCSPVNLAFVAECAQSLTMNPTAFRNGPGSQAHGGSFAPGLTKLMLCWPLRASFDQHPSVATLFGDRLPNRVQPRLSSLRNSEFRLPLDVVSAVPAALGSCATFPKPTGSRPAEGNAGSVGLRVRSLPIFHVP